MNAGRFISRGIRFKGKLAICATAVSFLVIILSIAIAGGFRNEIRRELARTYGDIYVPSTSSLPVLDSIGGIADVQPAICRTGIVKSGLHISGAQFLGTRTADTTALGAAIPASLAKKTGLSVGDKLQAYFVGEKVQARNFTVSGIYDDLAERSDAAVIKVSLKDMQRLEGLPEGGFTSLNVTLDDANHEREKMTLKAREISIRSGVLAESLPDRFPQLFDWLDLIDANVLAILLLMAVVAGFNMISGLLILLFRNISTIGTLKALGMTNRGIAGVFLRVGSVVTLKGMAIGNALALLFCLIQDKTHLIPLNPDNYFVSFVPVSADIPSFIAADISAYLIIVALLLLPTLFISRVDPAKTVREDQS